MIIPNATLARPVTYPQLLIQHAINVQFHTVDTQILLDLVNVLNVFQVLLLKEMELNVLIWLVVNIIQS